MRIDGALPLAGPPVKETTAKSIEPGFREALRSALEKVNDLQIQSDVAYQQLIAGDIEFHDAMIIAEQASLALQLTMAIRSKVIEAYQEIMRMQV